MVAEFFVELRRCRIEMAQHSFDQRGLERLRLLPMAGAQEWRGLERKSQIRLQIPDQQKRGHLNSSQLADFGPLFEVSHQGCPLGDAEAGSLDDTHVEMEQSVTKAGANRDLVCEHFLR